MSKAIEQEDPFTSNKVAGKQSDIPNVCISCEG